MLDNRNAAIWFVDRHVEEGRGSNVAFREADGQRRSQTYAELAERSDLLAGAFESAGLRREERVACLILDQCAAELLYHEMRQNLPHLFSDCYEADYYNC